MECTPPFELKDLRRDWIAGVSGGAFVARVKRRIVAIKATSDACERGVMIAEKDPVRFASGDKVLKLSSNASNVSNPIAYLSTGN